MSTMSTTPPATPAPPEPGRPHAGVPRWAWALIAVLALIAVVATTVAITGRSDGDESAADGPGLSPVASPSAQRAIGCLGGPGDSLARGLDLDRAMLDAQLDAPLTAEGAAAFTATLYRWASALPPPADKASTARKILADDATRAARDLAGVVDPENFVVRPDLSDGQYYIESFDGKTAVVSWTGSHVATKGSQELGEAVRWGTTHLVAVDGVWRFQDQSVARSLEEIQRLGTRYNGGC